MFNKIQVSLYLRFSYIFWRLNFHLNGKHISLKKCDVTNDDDFNQEAEKFLNLT